MKENPGKKSESGNDSCTFWISVPARYRTSAKSNSSIFCWGRWMISSPYEGNESEQGNKRGVWTFTVRDAESRPHQNNTSWDASDPVLQVLRAKTWREEWRQAQHFVFGRLIWVRKADHHPCQNYAQKFEQQYYFNYPELTSQTVRIEDLGKMSTKKRLKTITAPSPIKKQRLSQPFNKFVDIFPDKFVGGNCDRWTQMGTNCSSQLP